MLLVTREEHELMDGSSTANALQHGRVPANTQTTASGSLRC
jgi:hypothetical protein